MRKLQHLLYMLLVGMAITAFTACSDDDDYQPAQKVAEDNMGAYFAAANAASEVLTPEEYAARPKVDLKVKRQNTKGDVSIPVVVDKADAVFRVPATVEFKDGESEATLSVACPGLQALQSYQFTIHLDEAATNPYVKVDGSPVFNYTVMVARWVKVVENATFMYQSDIFPSVKSDIYQLEGQNKFYIENYLGSGINLGFYIIPQDANGTWTASAFSASDRSTWKGIFMPADHYMNDPDGGTYWYLMKDADNNEYASWTPEGADKGISYINFYLDTTSDDYASIDMSGSTTSYAGFQTPYIYYSDGNESGYTYIYMYWDSTNIPAAE